jgi:anthranilate synthase component 2
VTVKRNDEIELADVRELDPDGIVISPGPGSPEDPAYFGVCRAVLEEVSPEVPTLGVCLGMQGFVHAYGGDVVRAPRLMHGKACTVDHDGQGVYEGLDQGFQAGRYHSLIAEDVPGCFEVSATTDHDGDPLVMGVRHREHPIRGVQFHPESVLTAVGHDVVRNFLATVR